MPVAVDEQSVKRLAFIRMLYEQGVAQAKQPMPMGASGILPLHDAVEMFLVLAGEVLNEPVDKNTKFLDFWRKFKTVELSQGHAMQRLNNDRNDLKHAGGIPSEERVAAAVASTFAFFDDNVPRVFTTSLWSVDTSYVIPQADARKWVKKATDRFDAGEGGAALALLQLALLHVLRSHRWPHSTLMAKVAKSSFRSRLASDFRAAFGRSFNVPVSDAARALEQMEKTIGALQDGFQWVALGGNLYHYARFQMLTPSTIHWAGGTDEEAIDRILTSQRVASMKPTREEFEFCRQFVVTTALRQADVETHIQAPSWLPEVDGTNGAW